MHGVRADSPRVGKSFAARYPRSMKSANGVLILILGILSLMMCGFFAGIPAWIMGNNSLREIDAGMADPGERGLVQAGRVCGIIGTCGAFVVIAIWILVFMVFGAVAVTQHPTMIK